jgi:hypothetical protein
MSEGLEWRVDVPFLTNSYMVMDLLFVIIGSAVGLGVILFLFMGGEDLLAILEILVLAAGALIMLTFLVIGVIFLNSVELVFKIDAKGVHCDLGEYAGNLNRLAWVVGSISHRVNPVGSSFIAMSRENTFIPWGAIKKAVFDGKKRVISLSSARRLLLRVYCTPQNYDNVAETIDDMLPDAELKRI